MNRFTLVCLTLFGIASCSYDEIMKDPDGLQCLNNYTYETNIQFIIQDNCAYSGCHNGASAAPGTFLDFDGLKSRLENGQFEERVLILRNMPPPEGDPPQLSEQDLNALQCWAQQGFPEM